MVPAGRARSCGFDSSMVLGYGHDDRICAYTSLVAQLEAENVKRTAVCLLVDKEEVGSQGATGMHSMFFENFVAEVMECMGDYSALSVKRAMMNSTMLSSDVSRRMIQFMHRHQVLEIKQNLERVSYLINIQELVVRVDVTMRTLNISH